MVKLRKVRDPRFLESRRLFGRQYRICLGPEDKELCFGFSAAEFARLNEEQRRQGVALVAEQGRERLWWAGRDDLFWADDELQAEEVELLLWDRKRRLDARLKRLRHIRAREERIEGARRERIPIEVRNFVWRRDEGRCVLCGSEDDLQFDHVIPFCRGGGNDAANIQILCGACNREKGDGLG